MRRTPETVRDNPLATLYPSARLPWLALLVGALLLAD